MRKLQEKNLRNAARTGDIAATKKLLLEGTDVNAADTDQFGATPLHHAAINDHKEVVQLLLAEGANINGTNEFGATALHLASSNNHRKTAQLLLEKGADMNATDEFGRTPLMVAQEERHGDVVALLERPLQDATLQQAASYSPKEAVKSSTVMSTANTASSSKMDSTSKSDLSAPPSKPVNRDLTAAPSSLKNAAQSSTVAASVTTPSSSTMDSSSISSLSAPASKPVNRDLDQFLLKYVDYFRDFNDISNTMSLDELLDNLMDLKTDVFLSHDWGVGGANHRRVAEINTALKARGLVTWFDEERMEGGVHDKMQEGIDNCKCVVVFITRKYMEKVAGKDAGDNCQLEFKYATRRKGNNKMIPVVMEPTVRDMRTWTGPVDFQLGGQLYVDFAEPTLTPEKVHELHSRIMSIIRHSRQSVIDSLLQYNSRG